MSFNRLKVLYNKNKWLKIIAYAGLMLAAIILFYNVLRDIEFINTLYVKVLNEFAVFLLFASEFFLELFGVEVITYGKTVEILSDFYNKGIYLDRGCMGRNVMLAYAAVVFIFPGKLMHKLWYIPAGLIVIILINIIRISALAYIALCCPEYSDINHYIIFKGVAWIAIFVMWSIWINKFSKAKPTSR
ncbi:MAG: hypothetical protein U9N85_05365 [Bacteroidota bacterium]|nr:hypothetical protein [Bacteroidota bacterium]